VTSSVTWPSDSAWALSYWWSMMTMCLSCTDTEIRGFKDFGVTSLTFCGDHLTRHKWFSIGGPLEPCIYLAPLRRYAAPKILGSRAWPFGVTWRHRSRDHRTRRGHFPIGGQWWPCVYLTQIRRYRASEILGSRVWPFGVTWRHRSRKNRTWTWTIGLGTCGFLLVVHWHHASILHRYGDIKPQSCICPC